MKFLGIILIALCFSLTGFRIAAGFTQRLRLLEMLLMLLQSLRQELMLTHASSARILEQLKKKSSIPLLEHLTDRCKAASFPQAWQKTMETELSILSERQRAPVLAVGSILGSGDLRHQEEALLQCEKQLRGMIKSEKENCMTQGKLFRSLGVLTGLMAAVILV